MAILNYKDKNGVHHKSPIVNVQNVVVVQKTGESELDVMSQKAVTECLELLDDKIYKQGKDFDYELTKYYTKEEIDSQNAEFAESVTNEITEAVKAETERATEAEKTLQENIDSLKGESEKSLNDFKEEVNGKFDEVNSHIGSVESNLQDQISKEAEDFENLAKSIEETNANLQNQVEKEENDRANLQNQIDELDNRQTASEGNIEQLQQDLSDLQNTHKEDVEDLNNKITELDTKVDNAVNDINTSINDLDEKLTKEIEDLDEKLTKEIEDLDEKVDNNKSECEKELSNAKSELNKSISDLEAKHDGDVQNINSTLQVFEETYNQDKSNLIDKLGQITSDIENEVTRAKSEEESIKESLKLLVNDAKWDRETKRINFYHDDEVLAWIDGSEFVKDGMVRKVSIVTDVDDVRYLEIVFNTDAEIEPIRIPLNDIFNPDNYYTKNDVDRTVIEINAKITSLQQEDIYIKGMIENHSEKIESIRNEINHIKEEITDINIEVNQLKKDKDNLVLQVNSLQKDMAFANDNIKHLEDDVEDIYDRLRDKLDVAQYERDKEELENNLGEFEQKEQGHYDELLGLINTNKNLQDNENINIHNEIDSLSNDLKENYYFKTDVDEFVRQLQEQITELKETIKWYENK